MERLEGNVSLSHNPPCMRNLSLTKSHETQQSATATRITKRQMLSESLRGSSSAACAAGTSEEEALNVGLQLTATRFGEVLTPRACRSAPNEGPHQSPAAQIPPSQFFRTFPRANADKHSKFSLR